VQPISIEDLVL
jgi:hypothetical protein